MRLLRMGLMNAEPFSEAEGDLRYTRMEEMIVPRLTPIMVAAFDDDSQRFRGIERGGPPGYDDGSFLRRWGLQSPTQSYAIWQKDSLIGAYIVWWRAEESRLGAVFLHPAVQGQGIGQRLWRHIEQTYPAKSWVLDTPTWAVRCHHFYERCGFTRAGASGDQVVFRKRLATT